MIYLILNTIIQYVYIYIYHPQQKSNDFSLTKIQLSGLLPVDRTATGSSLEMKGWWHWKITPHRGYKAGWLMICLDDDVVGKIWEISYAFFFKHPRRSYWIIASLKGRLCGCVCMGCQWRSTFLEKSKIHGPFLADFSTNIVQVWNCWTEGSSFETWTMSIKYSNVWIIFQLKIP